MAAKIESKASDMSMGGRREDVQDMLGVACNSPHVSWVQHAPSSYEGGRRGKGSYDFHMEWREDRIMGNLVRRLLELAE